MSVMDAAVATFLDSGRLVGAAHIALIEGAAVVAGLSKLGGPITSIPSNIATDVMNQLNLTTMDPNIEGIPIHTDAISVTRDVEVSTTPVIVQSLGIKEQKIDNATPHPRVWELTGYLSEEPSTDAMLVIKPSLLMQTKYLDSMAVSRKPCWFKTNNSEFYQVLIESLNMSQEPQAINLIKISLRLREYVPLAVNALTTVGL